MVVVYILLAEYVFGWGGRGDMGGRCAAGCGGPERDSVDEPPAGSGERADIAPELPQAGELVSVRRYGRGVVEAVSAEGVTVVFPEGSRRVFLPAFVRREQGPKRQPQEPAKVTASAA
jgi:hypothetical protein